MLLMLLEQKRHCGTGLFISPAGVVTLDVENSEDMAGWGSDTRIHKKST